MYRRVGPRLSPLQIAASHLDRKNIMPKTVIAMLSAISLMLFAAFRVSASEVTSPLNLSDEQIGEIVHQYRAGDDLTPSEWPGAARLAVLFSIDIDNEAMWLAEGVSAPSKLSNTEFGGRRGLARLTGLFDAHDIPVTFFVPAVSLKIAPDMAGIISEAGHHEVALHGWVHEYADTLSEAEHRDSLQRSIEYLEKTFGERPVGYRAPAAIMAPHTAKLLREMNLLYDSSLLADDRPYELLADGEPTGIVELPLSFNTEDSMLVNEFENNFSQILAPRDVLQLFKDEFDVAHKEGGMMVFVIHPHVSGRRAQSLVFQELIEYMKARDDVWFGTHRQAAEYIIDRRGQQ